MSELTPSSLFLVSGGARGITAQCVIRMAQRYQCTFILLGRSTVAGSEPIWAAGISDEAELKSCILADFNARGEKATPVLIQRAYNKLRAAREVKETLQAIAQAGGQAEYVSVDITDRESLRNRVKAVAAQMGPVTGIIHGAGNLADKRIENKTEQDFETVYAAKVHGLENLLQCVDPHQLAYLVMFSSVAGFYGNVGQTDYAIANEILNKAAYLFKQQYPACHVVSINWGPWEAGMVTPELKQYFTQHGIRMIPVEVGAQLLMQELEAQQQDTVQVVIGGGIGVRAGHVDSELRAHRIRRKMILTENPFLADHVVNSSAVLPMVSAMAWMANTCEQLYPGYQFFSFRDYRVLKGIVFDETLADEYVLDLQETAKSTDDISFEAKVWSQSPEGKVRYHYSALLKVVRELPVVPFYEGFDPSAAQDIDGATYYQNGTLFHGWSFQGVERVLNISTEKVTMRCRLPHIDERYQGQFPAQAFNYFMTDIGFQSMGIWVRHHYDAASLPLKADYGELYRDVSFGEVFYVSLEIRSHSATGVVTDLMVHDEQGRLYAKIEGCGATISKALNPLFLLNRLPEAIQ